jgi:hypothetical protein
MFESPLKRAGTYIFKGKYSELMHDSDYLHTAKETIPASFRRLISMSATLKRRAFTILITIRSEYAGLEQHARTRQ